MDINQIKSKTLELASQLSVPFDTDDMYFGCCSPIYLATTSNVRNTLSVYNNYCNVLAVGGTGAHGYEALIHGAKKVDLFDINELQRLYFLYMKTAIMILPYEDFIRYFTFNINDDNFCGDINIFLNSKLFKKLEKFLPNDVKEVFGTLWDNYSSDDIFYSRLVRSGHNFSLEYLKGAVSFYEEDNYNKLQNILRSNPNIISYFVSSLTELSSKINNVYDLVLLDNILEYYDKIPELDSIDKIDVFIKNSMRKLVVPGGQIQVGYAYGYDTDVFCQEFGITDIHGIESFEDTYSNVDFFFDDFFPSNSFLISHEELKSKNLILQLMRKKCGYRYDIFDGINELEGKNMVLTYRRPGK